MIKNTDWIYGGQLLRGKKAQMPVISVDLDHPCIMHSSRDDFGKSYGVCSHLESLFPPRISHSETILEHGPIGSYDVAGVMPMQLIKNYLFYIGWTLRKDIPYFNYLSVCETDGKTFKKKGPILGPDIHESGYTGTFHVQNINNYYLGYYLSVTNWSEDEKGNLNPEYDIKIARSDDLLTWERLNHTAVSRVKDEAAISAFTVLKIQNLYHAWFSVRKGKNFRNKASNGYRIMHATSFDGISWTRDSDFGINPSSFTGCEDMAAYPSVYISDSKVIMLFNGNGFGDEGIFWCYMPIKEFKGV